MEIPHSSGPLAAGQRARHAPRGGPRLPRRGPGTPAAERTTAVAPGGAAAEEAAGRADGGTLSRKNGGEMMVVWGFLYIYIYR